MKLLCVHFIIKLMVQTIIYILGYYFQFVISFLVFDIFFLNIRKCFIYIFCFNTREKALNGKLATLENEKVDQKKDFEKSLHKYVSLFFLSH